MLASSVGWPDVMIALIAGLPAIIAAITALLVRRSIQTPSGEKIGTVVEKAHDLTAADLAMTTRVHTKVTEPK